MNIKKRLISACVGFSGVAAIRDSRFFEKQNCNSVPRDCTASLFLTNSENLGGGAEDGDLVGFFPNEAPPLPDLDERGGTWVMISPYGRHSHSAGMQVFEREDAETLVNEFQKWWNFGARKMGLPWYVGHPDHPGFANRDTDTRAYGRIRKLEAREDGFWGKVFFSDSGRALVNERAYHGHSPNWSVVRRDGSYHPVSLRSVGFTNMPNISVTPILHANEKISGSNGGSVDEKKQKQKDKMITKIKEILLSIGKLKPGASDDDVCGGVEALANEIEELGKSLSNSKAELGKQTKLANERGADDDALSAAKMEFANERKARAELLVDKAVAEGRVAISDRDERVESLSNEADFDAAVTVLANAKSTLKTQSMVGGLGERNPANDKKSLVELANERALDDSPAAFDVAWKSLKKDMPERFSGGDEK